MSSTHGLKGKVKKLVREMHAIRTNAQAPRDISMREHLAESYKVAPEQMFSELGVDPDFTRVVDLMQDDDLKYLIPEAVRQGIQTGMGAERASRRSRWPAAPSSRRGRSSARATAARATSAPRCGSTPS